MWRKIDLVDIKRDGTIDLALDHLKELLRPDTIVVAVTMVDSELGVVQPVQEIARDPERVPSLPPACGRHPSRGQNSGLV